MRKEYPEEVVLSEDNSFLQPESELIPPATRRCLSRLGSSERGVIERIYTRKQDRPMLDILAQVLQHQSLQPGFTAGKINRLLRMKSPDTLIMGAGNMGDLDPESVEMLQGRSPVWSTNDHVYISQLLRSGSLMPRVTDQATRKAIGRRVLSISRIMPSMYTFMEDTKYFLPCALALRRLIPDGPRDTIRKSLWHQFRPRRRSRHTGQSGFLQAYRRLWLYTVQHFPILIGAMPLLDHRGAERRLYRSQEESQRCWATFSLIRPPLSTTYSASVYETTTALSSRRQSPEPFTALVEMTKYGNLNPYYSPDLRAKSLSSACSLDMSLEYEQPPAAPGLLGEKTIHKPQDYTAPLKSLSGDKGILYEIGIPATVFYLPLARVDRLFAQYSQNHANHRYAIIAQDRLCPIHPAAVPSHLRSTVVVTGPNLA
ncbi:hypothetical protein BDV38DRAFT_287736 [Aspergillus pseudotamarii]|uniref:Uncharacterized protein n=1 Tax=Aspergillus pseudotamarii TaxID=132259 RepID=A0A5N6SFD3_ASPPS|nr:uncharacterized protein BDV38DRAFT_287736 [Aspergillus pseudotamarii]KAE8132420.1 hypothetical protein BDV38DRAFT_287736 [Aspergillus pseudotamarii]